jgi:hypothetical protein
MLLTTLTAAVLSTVFLAILWYVDANTPPLPPAPPPRGGPPPPPPPPGRAVVALAAGTFAIAWVSVIVVACRDQILRRIEQISDRVAAASIEFAEQREEEGVFRGMRIATEDSDRSVGGPGGPESGGPGGGPGGREPGGREPGGTGHVVPFPRMSPPAGNRPPDGGSDE